MLRTFIQASAVYGIARAIVLGVNIIALPIYTRHLGPAEYGVFEYLLVFIQIGFVVVALEVSQGLARFFGAADAGDARQAYGSTAFWFAAASYSVVALAICVFARPVSLALLDTERASVVRAAALAMWSTGLFYVAQNILRFQLRAGLYAAFSVLFAIGTVGTATALLIFWNAGVEGVFVGQFAGGAVALAATAWSTRSVLEAQFDWARCREMLAFSAPLVPSGLGVMLTLYLDRLAIARLMTFEDLGVYSVGFRIASVLSLAISGVQLAVTPLIYQHIDDPGTPRELARLFRWFAAGALSLIALLMLLSPELLLIAGDAYAAARPLVFLLSVALLLASLNVFAPGLWIAKRTGTVAAINLMAAVAALGLNFLLIPVMGLRGAAVAGLMASSAALAAYVGLGGRHYPVPLAWPRFVAGVAALALVYAVGGSGEASLALRLVLLAVCLPGVLLVLVGLSELAAGVRAAGHWVRAVRA